MASKGPGTALTLWLFLLLASSREAGAGKGKCEVCRKFVEAFNEGLKSTENSNFAGGDTRWEEEKLGSYANSEVRFVEILDSVCRDFECPGGTENPCGGHGTCEGAEEKNGEGKCRCNHGYSGDSCQECSSGFYDDGSVCVVCHRACRDGCSGGSPRDCEECASGYVRGEEEEEGAECRDVNECEEREKEMEEEGGGELKPLCEEGKYCFNMQGTYKCNDCDRACEKGCLGPGPAKCTACGDGYHLSRFNVCKDINECEGGEGWEGDPVMCEGATYCENTPGSHQCRACHVACLGGCRGAGPTNCNDCKDGFKMDDGECKDVNECEELDSLCDTESETCSNLIGSFKCKCRPGLVRVEGKCVEKIVEPTKKKSKKKKKKAKRDSAPAGGEAVEEGRVGEAVTAEQERERDENTTAEKTTERSESHNLTEKSDDMSHEQLSQDGLPDQKLSEGSRDPLDESRDPSLQDSRDEL